MIMYSGQVPLTDKPSGPSIRGNMPQFMRPYHMKKNSISGDILNLAWVLDDPGRLTVMLENIHNIPQEDNILIRLALARVQIDAALSMNENLQKYTKQKFVAETIERLIFGDLLVEGKSSKNNGNGKEKKIVTRKKASSPSGTGKKSGGK